MDISRTVFSVVKRYIPSFTGRLQWTANYSVLWLFIENWPWLLHQWVLLLAYYATCSWSIADDCPVCIRVCV